MLIIAGTIRIEKPATEEMAGWGVEGMDILKFDVESFDRMR